MDKIQELERMINEGISTPKELIIKLSEVAFAFNRLMEENEKLQRDNKNLERTNSSHVAKINLYEAMIRGISEYM